LTIGIAWDRTEKCIFLVLDLGLNWYFLKTVRTNLISNGIIKYKKLVKFNERIIVLSLLMDVMLIAATAIPKTWV
jgi:arginase family enzyme